MAAGYNHACCRRATMDEHRGAIIDNMASVFLPSSRTRNAASPFSNYPKPSQKLIATPISLQKAMNTATFFKNMHGSRISFGLVYITSVGIPMS